MTTRTAIQAAYQKYRQQGEEPNTAWTLAIGANASSYFQWLKDLGVDPSEIEKVMSAARSLMNQRNAATKSLERLRGRQ